MKNRILKHNEFSGAESPLLTKKTQRESTGMGYPNSFNSLMLEEVKKDKMKEMMRERYKINPKNERVWGKFYNKETGKYYYHNFLKRQSQWERPEDFEESIADEDKLTVEEAPKKIESNAGIIGKWEEVDKNESVYDKNKAKISEISMPGVISKAEYLRNEFGDDENSDDESPEGIEIPRHKERATELDKEIENISNEDFIKNKTKTQMGVNNNDLININKGLKGKDNDIKYITNIYIGNEGKNDKISFNLKNTKKNKKKLRLIQDDDD